MSTRTVGELGEFLRTRRAALTPQALGLPSYGRRRVPGLRREELAQLAGVSVAYYTRLEQGTSRTASEPVLDAIAHALDLDEDETAHLRLLAHPPRATRAPAAERPSRQMVRLIAGINGTPAVLIGRFQDVLAWNAEGHRLFAGHLPFEAPQQARTRPNMVKLLFLDPHGQDLSRDREHQESYAVSSLRYSAAEHPQDPQLVRLVGELSTGSGDFASRWARRTVRKCVGGSKSFRHPEFGDFDLQFESLEVTGCPGQRLLLLTAEPGSADESALALLSHAARCTP
ncbi:helix-turn-helix transcriptional regulator [Dermacoccaceae bacterium W4C1]